MQEMMDAEKVCCMCGDVGFQDKIFRCIKCQHRFQHSYCSNYNNGSPDTVDLCDWCQKDELQTSNDRMCSSSKKPIAKLEAGKSSRSENLGDHKVKHEREDGNSEKGKPPTGAPSPRTSARRYKLLKDVMC